MKIRFLESFYGGSHRDVADNLVRCSRHSIELSTLPARFWKWRMRGAALSFVRDLDPGVYDLIVCTDLMSVTDLAALLPGDRPPILLYAHETQLVYPTAGRNERVDLHFAFTDLTNMLAADHVAFNSHTHRDAYLSALPRFLRRLPEYRPMWAVDEIARKSSVCYPGISVVSQPPDGAREDRAPGGATSGDAAVPGSATGDALGSDTAEPPLILWNHRWEYDKKPDELFDALRVVRDRGYDFRLALLGENFQAVPRAFLRAREELGDAIVRFGYVADRAAYEGWLDRADLVVSTAIQENFGISVMEAIAHRAVPLLPKRLSYPEIIPAAYHSFLYEEGELADRLCGMLGGAAGDLSAPSPLVEHARSFAWDRRIAEFDALFERVAEHSHGTA